MILYFYAIFYGIPLNIGPNVMPQFVAAAHLGLYCLPVFHKMDARSVSLFELACNYSTVVAML